MSQDLRKKQLETVIATTARLRAEYPESEWRFWMKYPVFHHYLCFIPLYYNLFQYRRITSRK